MVSWYGVAVAMIWKVLNCGIIFFAGLVQRHRSYVRLATGVVRALGSPSPSFPLPVEGRGRTAGSGSGKFARLATIPGDTDRLEVRATFIASLQCYVSTSSRSAKIFQE